ncbi:MAG: 50S ribosomal protein L13 [Actinobacteria bacterium]|nr:50S ribosomal protein L13 [Actinomycetota bacterium]
MKTATRTYTPTPGDIERRWYVVDADGVVLGRLASEVAQVLRGKHKPMYAPHVDVGDHVIVVNARGIRLTGGKEAKKIAYHHSGYPGGLKETGYERLLRERPSFVVEKAIRGMLPKNRLGRAMARKLQVYDGAEHPHAAQQPTRLGLGEIPRWDGLPAPKPRAERPAPAGPGRRRKAAGTAKEAPARRPTREPGDGKEAAPAPGKPAGGPRAKRSAAKTPAKPSTAKRTTAKRTTAKRTTAKRSTAKRSAAEPASERSSKSAGKSPKTDTPKRSRAAKKEE